MEERGIGQGHALDAIAQRVRTSRANLEDPGKPKGVFLLVGTSGVGKPETAIALADVLYGGERNMIPMKMSEYQAAHTVSKQRRATCGERVWQDVEIVWGAVTLKQKKHKRTRKKFKIKN